MYIWKGGLNNFSCNGYSLESQNWKSDRTIWVHKWQLICEFVVNLINEWIDEKEGTLQAADMVFNIILL